MKNIFPAVLVALAILATGLNPAPTSNPEHNEQLRTPPLQKSITTLNQHLQNCHAYGERYNLHTVWSVNTGKCIMIEDTPNGYNTHPVAHMER